MNDGGIHYDPETGQRVATYAFVQIGRNANGTKWSEIGASLPFIAPPCFGHGKVTLKQKENLVWIAPVGCTVRYHPYTGRKLAEDEVALFTNEMVLFYSNVKGGDSEDTKNLSADSSRRLTSAKIEAIKKAAGTK
jgi:hypothetical protein